MRVEARGLQRNDYSPISTWTNLTGTGYDPLWCDNFTANHYLYSRDTYQERGVLPPRLGLAPDYVEERTYDDVDGDYVLDPGEPITHSSVVPAGVPKAQSVGTEIDAADPTAQLGDPVNTATGAFETRVTDLTLPGIGLPFEWKRYYSSANKTIGFLGKGWSHSYHPLLTLHANGDVSLVGEGGQTVAYRKLANGTLLPDEGVSSKLTPLAVGYELVRRDQTKLLFDSQGRLTEIADRNGNRLAIARTGTSGRPTHLTDSVGRIIYFTYNSTNTRLVKVTMPDGRFIEYGYDSSSRLTSVKDVRGNLTKYTYDGNGYLTSIVDQNQATVVNNTYDSTGVVTQQSDARGKVWTFTWDRATRSGTMTDPRGHQWRDIYSLNRLVARVDPLGRRTEYTWDEQLNLSAVTNPQGDTTAMTYDPAGNLLTRTAPAPLSYVETYTYSSRNDVTSYTDGRGKLSTFDYDPNGNLTRVARSGEVMAQLAYSPKGLVTSVTDARDDVTTYDRDAYGNVTRVTSPMGRVTAYTYDASGRASSVVEPRGNVSGADPNSYRWTATYDNANHTTSIGSPLGHTTAWTYDPAGNLDTMTDAKGRITDYSYDPARHLTSVDPPGPTPATTYGYDDAGNLDWRTDANQQTTDYVYDDAGRLVATVTPLGKRWDYTYDGNGNLKTVKDANTNSGAPGSGPISYAYDELNRLSSIDYPVGTPDVSFTYDPNSNLASMSDALGVKTYTYDDLDRLDTVTRETQTFDYDYNVEGLITKRLYPDGTVVTYDYDRDDNLDWTKVGLDTTDYSYDAAGNLKATLLPNGYSETATYDRAGRLEDIRHIKGNTTLSFATYNRDAVGNPTVVTTADGAALYAYDSLDRLERACLPPACLDVNSALATAWTYDAVGNRLTEVTPTLSTAYSYDADDRLTSSTTALGAVAYEHDHNGNMTKSGTTNYTYDAADRMSSVTKGGATTIYAYDGLGTRTSAATAATSTSYMWDENAALPQLVKETESGGTTTRYAYGHDLISMATGGKDFYFHHDGLGSVTDVTDAGGLPQWSYSYDPFGNSRSATKLNPLAPDNPMRFTGEYLDPSGLYHLRARQYDPSLGRFTATDPIDDPYVSAYAYVNNQPTVYVDPSGEIAIPLIVIGIVAIAGASAVAAEPEISAEMAEEMSYDVANFVETVLGGVRGGPTHAVDDPLKESFEVLEYDQGRESFEKIDPGRWPPRGCDGRHLPSGVCKTAAIVALGGVLGASIPPFPALGINAPEKSAPDNDE